LHQTTSSKDASKPFVRRSITAALNERARAHASVPRDRWATIGTAHSSGCSNFVFSAHNTNASSHVLQEWDIRNAKQIEECVRHSDVVYNLTSRDWETRYVHLVIATTRANPGPSPLTETSPTQTSTLRTFIPCIPYACIAESFVLTAEPNSSLESHETSVFPDSSTSPT
jgi:hypothetical protein